jgi:hypothetical protein
MIRIPATDLARPEVRDAGAESNRATSELRRLDRAIVAIAYVFVGKKLDERQVDNSHRGYRDNEQQKCGY